MSVLPPQPDDSRQARRQTDAPNGPTCRLVQGPPEVARNGETPHPRSTMVVETTFDQRRPITATINATSEIIKTIRWRRVLVIACRSSAEATICLVVASVSS